MPLPPRSPNQVRLRDVALEAGVSVTTASFVLNDRDAGIAETTKERVRTAAESLGYRPNASARALRRDRTDSIALITDEIATTAYAGDVILGAQDVAWANGKTSHLEAVAADAVISIPEP